jgi:hypothetical protein
MRNAVAYNVTYTPREMCGEPGHEWAIRSNGRLIAEGWTRGKIRSAQADVRETIRNREALRSAAGLATAASSAWRKVLV